MTGTSSNQPDPQPGNLPHGARLRAAADGELPPADRDALLASDPQAAARIRFEQDLRQAVGRSLGGTAAPAELRDRIARAVREAHGQRTENQPAEPADRRSTITTPMGDTRRRSFWAAWSALPRWGAVAAVLALCGAVIFVAARQGSAGGAPFPPKRAALLVTTLRQAHDSSVNFDDNYYQVRFRDRTIDAARTHSGEIFTHVPETIDVPPQDLAAAGYEFAGFAPCYVPGKGKSGHFVYRPLREGYPPVSLFVQNCTGELKLARGCCYGDSAGADPAMIIWRENGLIYYLVADHPESMKLCRKLFGAPEHQELIQ